MLGKKRTPEQTIHSATQTHKRVEDRVHLTIRVPKELRHALRKNALEQGISLTEYLTEVLQAEVNNQP